MHLAAEHGHGKLVELLLTAGAAADAKDDKGRGPCGGAPEPPGRGVDEANGERVDVKKECK